MDSMSNKYGHNDGLDNIRDEARAMFTSLCDAAIAHEQSQQEASADGLPVISECQNATMKEAAAELDTTCILSDCHY